MLLRLQQRRLRLTSGARFWDPQVGISGFQSRYNLDVPAIMAGLTLATLPIVAIYLFGQRFFVRGLVSGAAKGE